MSMSLSRVSRSISRICHRSSGLLRRLLLLLLIFLLLPQHLRIQLRCPLSSRTHTIHCCPTSCSVHCTLRNALSLLLLMNGFCKLVRNHAHDLLLSSLREFGLDLVLKDLDVRHAVGMLERILAHPRGASLAR